jgi:hypothetical protein
MRPLPVLLLAAGLTQAAGHRDPPTSEPPATGTLAVVSSTQGDDPDLDGFRLAVDGADSFGIASTGTIEIDLPAGVRSARGPQCAA